jgi:hypothetical protein
MGVRNRLKVLENTGNEGDFRARKLCKQIRRETKCGREKLANRRRKKKNVLEEGRAAINK